jgi:hypothetical protein
VASAWLAACGSTAGVERRTPGRYEQSLDTATNTCVHNPACYAVPAGEQAILPWLTRVVGTAEATVAALRLLDAATIARVERILTECADQANAEVNERMLAGRRPTREVCKETVGKDSRGRPVTRAMELGKEKHRVALQCVRERLEKEVPGNFSLEPHYFYDRKARRTGLLDPKQVEAWLREGLLEKLLGTLIPDVVIHAVGDPLKVQAVYEFKFPCPSSNDPAWRDYPEDHPYHPSNQGELYGEALGGGTALVAPAWGIVR